MLLRFFRYPYASARSRALAADFFRLQEVADLAGRRTRTEAAGNLAGRYSALAGGKDGDPEEGLGREFLLLGRSIARGLPGAARDLVIAYLRRVDAENLKVACRGLLSEGKTEDFRRHFLPAAPVGAVSTERLGEVESFEALPAALPRRPYRKALRRCIDLPPAERLLQAELSIDRLFWEDVSRCIRRLSPFDRLAAEEILGLRADLERLNVVHRGWRAGLGEKDILAFLPPLGGAFPGQRVRSALRSADPETKLRELFPMSVPGDPFSPEGEMALLRRLYRRLQAFLRSAPFDISVSLAALLLKELETRDILAVLSGLRLRRSKEEILSFLAGGG